MVRFYYNSSRGAAAAEEHYRKFRFSSLGVHGSEASRLRPLRAGRPRLSRISNAKPSRPANRTAPELVMDLRHPERRTPREARTSPGGAGPSERTVFEVYLRPWLMFAQAGGRGVMLSHNMVSRKKDAPSLLWCRPVQPAVLSLLHRSESSTP